jgi:hypothetical protein
MSKFSLGQNVRVIADANGLAVGVEAKVVEVFDSWVHIRAVDPLTLTALSKPAGYEVFTYSDHELEQTDE